MSAPAPDPPAPDPIEDLLAEALARYDQGGDAAVAAFVLEHAAHQTALQRGLKRCRELGMLGPSAAQRDFPERLGEFRLVRRLGSGGMGVVYEAEQTSLGRRVALKVVRPELLFFEGARERFSREIEAVARLSHPAVVPVLASGEQDGVPWYAMELLSGRTLQELTVALAGQDPARLQGETLHALLSPGHATATDPFRGPWWQTCARLVHQVALGLRHAHLRGIVHRDLKPSNVMVTPHGQAVLLDFGVATIAGSREFTRTGHTPGSPAFMSPEQLRGDAVDERTDVYSLAATLWQVLALRSPFRGVEDLQKIRDGDLPDLRAANREVPPELALVLRTAMDRDRERRYPDMEAFAADLQAVLHKEPIRARRLSVGLRLLRWCQRHRVAATALAAILVGSLVLPTVLAWHMRTANAELAAAKGLADDSLQVALDALDKVLLRLGNKQLRNTPQAETVAREALQDAVAMYRALLPVHPDHVRLRANAARALDSLAAAQERTGATGLAVAGLREAAQLLHDPRPDVPIEWLDGRAHVHMNLASILANHGRNAEVAAEIDAAERDFHAIADQPGKRVWALRGQGELCLTRAMLLDERRDSAAFERQLAEAVHLGREQLALEPQDAEARATLARRIDNLATFCANAKRPAEAEPLLQEALALAQGIPADARIWLPPPMVVAAVLETLGNLQLDVNDPAAEATLTECLRLREQAAADYAANLEIRTLLSGALHNLGRALVRLDQDQRALPLLQRARELERSVLREQPDSRMGRIHLVNTLGLLPTVHYHLGQRAALVGALEEFAAADDRTGALRTSARLWLRALELAEQEAPPELESLRAQYARRSLDLLLAAEQKGWGSGNRLDEPFYAPLLAFPEFTALKARLAARQHGDDATTGADK